MSTSLPRIKGRFAPRSIVQPVQETPTMALDSTSTTETAAAASKRDAGPKVVYIQLAEGTPKDAVLSVHTNTRTLVDAMESASGSTYVKHTLPQGEPRPKRSQG